MALHMNDLPPMSRPTFVVPLFVAAITLSVAAINSFIPDMEKIVLPLLVLGGGCLVFFSGPILDTAGARQAVKHPHLL